MTQRSRPSVTRKLSKQAASGSRTARTIKEHDRMAGRSSRPVRQYRKLTKALDLSSLQIIVILARALDAVALLLFQPPPLVPLLLAGHTHGLLSL